MAINNEQLEWTRTQLREGVPVDDLRAALQAKGVSDKDIRYALKKLVPKSRHRQLAAKDSARTRRRGSETHSKYAALAEPALVRRTDGHRVVPLAVDEIQLFEMPDFLNADQCDTLIDIIRSNAHPSQVDGFERQSAMRSSRTCSLAVYDHPFVAGIDQAISRTLGMSLAWSETNQGQWYEPGEEYRPHPDYFPPGTAEFARFASSKGQRTWTFMVYLNRPERGGGTHFTKIDHTILPERGKAVCWNNLTRSGQPNPWTEHAGLPVEAGSKFIITKWFRDRGNGSPWVA